jgi:hypothetical protein
MRPTAPNVWLSTVAMCAVPKLLHNSYRHRDRPVLSDGKEEHVIGDIACRLSLSASVAKPLYTVRSPRCLPPNAQTSNIQRSHCRTAPHCPPLHPVRLESWIVPRAYYASGLVWLFAAPPEVFQTSTVARAPIPLLLLAAQLAPPRYSCHILGCPSIRRLQPQNACPTSTIHH